MVKTGARYRVEDLVPHRGAMSLLDSIDDYGPDWLRATVTVSYGGSSRYKAQTSRRRIR